MGENLSLNVVAGRIVVTLDETIPEFVDGKLNGSKFCLKHYWP